MKLNKKYKKNFIINNKVIKIKIKFKKKKKKKNEIMKLIDFKDSIF